MRAIQAVRKTTVKHQVQHRERSVKKRLKAVEERRNRQWSILPEIPFPIFVLTVSVLAAGIIINVAQKAIVSQISYEIESVKKEIQQAQQVQDGLLAKKARLESPQRIESVAVKKLLMVKAPKISYLRVYNSRGDQNEEQRLSDHALAR